MKLLFEKIYPYLLGLIAGVVWLESGASFPSENEVLSSTLSVAGVFVGFLATSKAILISTNSGVLKDLRASGYINELVSYIGSAIWLNLAFCAFDVVGYFVGVSSSWYGPIWISLATASMLAFVRVTHIMLIVFRHS